MLDADAHSAMPIPIGITERQLYSSFGPRLKLDRIEGRTRVFEIQRQPVLGLPARIQIEVRSRVYRLTVTMMGLGRCHRYERELRKLRGEPTASEWGTRAYEMTWEKRQALPRTHYWLHAFVFDGPTACQVTFGPRKR